MQLWLKAVVQSKRTLWIRKKAMIINGISLCVYPFGNLHLVAIFLQLVDKLPCFLFEFKKLPDKSLVLTGHHFIYLLCGGFNELNCYLNGLIFDILALCLKGFFHSLPLFFNIFLDQGFDSGRLSILKVKADSTEASR